MTEDILKIVCNDVKSLELENLPSNNRSLNQVVTEAVKNLHWSNMSRIFRFFGNVKVFKHLKAYFFFLCFYGRFSSYLFILFNERVYQFGKGEDSLEDKVHSSLIPSIKNLFKAEIQHKDILLKK